MHDVLEGSLELCVRYMLSHFICEHLFTLDVLNSRIKLFTYGIDIKNKPTSQMWCLGRVLPFLIGEFVPEDSDHWFNFLTLLVVMDFVFAPTTTVDKANLVATLICDFLVDFKELYPQRPLTPKMHYMIHMPSWMKWCGPLCRVWCMRFEAKHSFFKHLANILGNFKNVVKTLSKSITVSSLSYANKLIVEPGIEEDSTLYRVYSVDVRGTKEAVIVISVSEDDVPLFGLISEFMVTPHQEILFVCTNLLTLSYCSHYHAYEVSRTNEVVILRLTDLHDFHPLKLTSLVAKLFVSPKYHLFRVNSVHDF